MKTLEELETWLDAQLAEDAELEVQRRRYMLHEYYREHPQATAAELQEVRLELQGGRVRFSVEGRQPGPIELWVASKQAQHAQPSRSPATLH